jgi:putative Holliday junction resolvase
MPVMPEKTEGYPGVRTILGFDYGKTHIGVAVGQELIASARPLVTLQTRQKTRLWRAIGELIEQWRPALLVVGIPRYADDSASAMTLAAQKFGRQLAGRYKLPVETIDERLSSFAAGQLLQHDLQRQTSSRRYDKNDIDQIAAALILESWFSQQ